MKLTRRSIDAQIRKWTPRQRAEALTEIMQRTDPAGLAKIIDGARKGQTGGARR